MPPHPHEFLLQRQLDLHAQQFLAGGGCACGLPLLGVAVRQFPPRQLELLPAVRPVFDQILAVGARVAVPGGQQGLQVDGVGFCGLVLVVCVGEGLGFEGAGFLVLGLAAPVLLQFEGVVPAFVAGVAGAGDVVADVPAPPLAVELLLYELHDALLLGLDAGLLLAEAVQLGLAVGDLAAVEVGVGEPRVGVAVPDVEDGDEDVAAQVVEGGEVVGGQVSRVVGAVLVVEGVSSEAEDVEQ